MTELPLAEVLQLPWKEVESSNLHLVAGVEGDDKLYVMFRNGRLYCYDLEGENATAWVEVVRTAGSPGGVFNAQVRGWYRCEEFYVTNQSRVMV